MTYEGLTRRDEDHTYWLNGVQLRPSVTEALAVKRINYGPTAASRGHDVHSICQFYDEGDLDLNSVDQAYRGYLESYVKLLEMFKPIWQQIEWVVYHPVLLYPGTLDRYGIMGGRLTVLDIKSGGIGSAGPQTAAYAMAVDQKGFPTIRRCAWKLRKDGKIGTHHEFSDQADYINWLTKLSEWRSENA